MPVPGELREELNKETVSLEEMKNLKEAQERVAFIEDYVNRMVEYDSAGRERCFDNIRMYFGADNMQWPADIVAEHVKQRRQIVTLNLARQKLDTLAGSLLTNKYEFDFVPLDVDKSQWQKAIEIYRGMMYSDREVMDWDIARREAVRDGLIYEGVEEIFVDYTNDKTLGNIGFRRLEPGHVIFDYKWRSGRTHDCERAAKISYLTGKQILKIYKKNNAAIVAAYLRDKKGEETGGHDGIIFEPNLSGFHGSLYKVIEFFEMKDIEEEYDIDTETGMELPDSDDVVEKLQWLFTMKPGRNIEDLPNKVQHETRTNRVMWTTTICLDLDRSLILTDGPDPIQINRLKFFPISACRMNGEKAGIMDMLKDIQRMLNYRESLFTYAIQTQVSGGLVVDEGLVGEKKEEFRTKKNDPSYVLYTSPGMTNKYPNGIQAIRKGTFPMEAFTQITHLIDLMDRIGFVPAVMDARSEKSGESGVLNAQKEKRAEIGMYCLSAVILQHENDKGEAYVMQAKHQYGNNDVKKRFTILSAKKVITVNNHVPLSDGTERIENRVADLPRTAVIVTESPQGETRRMTTLMVSNDLLQRIPAEDAITRELLTNKVVGATDAFGEKDKGDLEEAHKLQMERAKAQVMADTAMLNLKTAEAMQKMQMMEQQAQQMQIQAQTIQGQPGMPGSPLMITGPAAGQPPAPGVPINQPAGGPTPAGANKGVTQ
jgi:hypothetical protein